ncbi:hypothetical protein C5F49_04635 [Nitrosopumilus oxyclinae]|uniref:Uncharacterized protein n=1 Tax=Nitrosopumilus oxyclinae TaxID=1959104 RepID=A0A7D5M1E1_9ARCH|nr:hypothetical protein [Nitrosopumilus oxyclinae]QLH04674.1 hypothetical protein C5F49_04635 [Nitrosopumilus oxyclinae]
MVKSLGDYNKEKSSSSDVNNITWTKKKPVDVDKPRNNNKKKISPTNIIYSKNNKPSKTIKKIYKIEDISSEEKTKNDISDRMFEKSSVNNSKIKPSFKRPAR